jgi:hypothetical protein
MMQQSSALRRLEEILTSAVTNGKTDQASGPILLNAMGLGPQPHNIVDFYELLNKAEGEGGLDQTLIDTFRPLRNSMNFSLFSIHGVLHGTFFYNYILECCDVTREKDLGDNGK